MSSNKSNTSDESNSVPSHAAAGEQGGQGYGSPTPEEEMPPGAATNPGSPDPTLRGQQTDREALGEDQSLGAPDASFFEQEDAGSDGEPGAGRLGGTDEQSREELAMAGPQATPVGTTEQAAWEAPSTDAPLDKDNTGPVNGDREFFSSESDDDAAGA